MYKIIHDTWRKRFDTSVILKQRFSHSLFKKFISHNKWLSISFFIMDISQSIPEQMTLFPNSTVIHNIIFIHCTKFVLNVYCLTVNSTYFVIGGIFFPTSTDWFVLNQTTQLCKNHTTTPAPPCAKQKQNILFVYKNFLFFSNTKSSISQFELSLVNLDRYCSWINIPISKYFKMICCINRQHKYQVLWSKNIWNLHR